METTLSFICSPREPGDTKPTHVLKSYTTFEYQIHGRTAVSETYRCPWYKRGSSGVHDHPPTDGRSEESEDPAGLNASTPRPRGQAPDAHPGSHCRAVFIGRAILLSNLS